MYMNTTHYNLTKLHKILMTSARTAIGDYCCRSSITAILTKCNWISIDHMVLHSSLTILHSIFQNKKPRSIINLFKMNENSRSVKEIYPKYVPKSALYLNFYSVKGLKLYNKIPQNIKIKNKISFKKN